MKRLSQNITNMPSVVDEYRQSIKDLKQEASELQIRSKLASAERRAASLATDMKSNLDTVGLHQPVTNWNSVLPLPKQKQTLTEASPLRQKTNS